MMRCDSVARLLLLARMFHMVVFQVAPALAVKLSSNGQKQPGLNDGADGQSSKIPLRMPGKGWCTDTTGVEATSRRLVKTDCDGARTLCDRDMNCVAWACKPNASVLYTSTDCETGCQDVRWILNPGLINHANHTADQLEWSEGSCFKWLDGIESVPCTVPQVWGADPITDVDIFGATHIGNVMGTVRCSPGTRVAPNVSCTWEAQDNFTCLGTTQTCSRGNFSDLPVCLHKCHIPKVQGAQALGACADQNDLVDNGTECTWASKATHDCVNTTLVCRNGTFLPNMPSCQAKCPVPMVVGAVSNCTQGGLVSDGSVCMWSPLNSHAYECTGVGMHRCVGGSFQAAPTCVAKCAVPIVIGARVSGCSQGAFASNGTACTWKELATHSCENLGALLCVEGTFLTQPSCVEKCTVPTVDGATVSGCTKGGTVENGTVCAWNAEDSHVCTAGMGSAICIDGTFSGDTPQCDKKCTVPVVAGASPDTCTEGLQVDPGTNCTWSADIGYDCTSTGMQTCDDAGNFSATPVCVMMCDVPNITGVTVSNCEEGKQVRNGTTCTWIANRGHNCSDTGPVLCKGGRFSRVPSCALIQCVVPNVAGALVRDCVEGNTVNHGTACTWEAEAGFACKNAGEQVCGDAGGFLAAPSCSMTAGIHSTNKWVYQMETSANFFQELITENELSMLKTKPWWRSSTVACDLSFFVMRDNSGSSSYFKYYNFDTDEVHTQVFGARRRRGFNHLSFRNDDDCTRFTCHGSPCPWSAARILLMKVSFLPRHGYAQQNQWRRNRYTMNGSHYYVTKSDHSTGAERVASAVMPEEAEPEGVSQHAISSLS